jgi:2-iminobutanoate/2-iminopropanoate deaminase
MKTVIKTVISTPEAPGAIGPYSQAIASGGMLFCSGQIPLDPDSGELLQQNVTEQTKLVLNNLGAVLRAAGLGFEHVVKTTVFLTDLNKFSEMNAVYGAYFAALPPARSTIQVAALPKGANVEIEAIAIKPS